MKTGSSLFYVFVFWPVYCAQYTIKNYNIHFFTTDLRTNQQKHFGHGISFKHSLWAIK